MINKTKNKILRVKTAILSGIILTAVLLAVITVLIYVFQVDNKLTIKAKNIIPFPAIIIDKATVITFRDIQENTLSVRKFYEDQKFSELGVRIDFSTEDGVKRLKFHEKDVINKMIEDSVVEKLAQERGIEISDKLVEEAVSRKINEYGGQEIVVENLQKLYGWSLDDFRSKIVKPSFYREKLEKWLKENDAKQYDNDARKTVKIALEKLNIGEEFTAVAKKYSKGASAEQGGEMGWFKKGQIMPNLQEYITTAKINQYSEVLESDLGFHIIVVEEKKENDGEMLYKLKQIFVPRLTLAEWLDKKIKEIKIWEFLSEYEWSKESGMIEFKNNEMKNFKYE